MKGHAFQPVLFDPSRGDCKNVPAIFVKAEDKTSVHLDAMIVEKANAASVILTFSITQAPSKSPVRSSTSTCPGWPMTRGKQPC